MNKVLFFSGAGLSADSGLGTFRGSGGLWEKYDLNKVCNYNTWRDNYKLVHEFYSMRRVEYAKAQPNAIHNAIAQLQQKYGVDKVVIITQNVDDLLERAGCSDVLHVHGDIRFVYCVSCEKKFEVRGMFEGNKCEKCGGSVFKPYIVFFGEQAPAYSPMYEAVASLDEADMIAVIGTEGSVVPIGAMIGKRERGIPAKRLLCNLDPSPYIDDKDFDIVYYEEAANAAPKILAEAVKILEGTKV